MVLISDNISQFAIHIQFLEYPFFNLDLSQSYLNKWLSNLLPVADTFHWIELRDILLWSTGNAPVKDSANLLLEKGFLQTKDFDQLFAEFTHVKNFLKGNPDILKEWNENNTPIVDRWMRVFSHLKQQSLSFSVIFQLVEYVLVIPGEMILSFCQKIL